MKKVNIKYTLYYFLNDLYAHCTKIVKIKGGMPQSRITPDYTLLMDSVALETKL